MTQKDEMITELRRQVKGLKHTLGIVERENLGNARRSREYEKLLNMIPDILIENAGSITSTFKDEHMPAGYMACLRASEFVKSVLEKNKIKDVIHDSKYLRKLAGELIKQAELLDLEKRDALPEWFHVGAKLKYGSKLNSSHVYTYVVKEINEEKNNWVWLWNGHERSCTIDEIRDGYWSEAKLGG